MGARGPLAKKPSERQNRNPHKLVVLPPAPPIAPPIPAPPEGLLLSSVARWNEFWSSDVARVVDRLAHISSLRDWVRAVDERDRVVPVLHQAPIVRGSTGQPVLNPLAQYAVQLDAQIARAERDFGMTPGAAARLGLTVGQARLTAATLNAMLDRSGAERTIDADWAHDFEPA